MSYRGKIYLKMCILVLFTGTGVSKVKLQNRTELKALYYSDRRWYLRNKNVKHILHWTSPKFEPFNADGIAPFIKANCSLRNCILTTNKARFKDLRYFDAIIFHGPDFWYRPSLLDKLPAIRSRRQIYIYYSAESADYYPMCDAELDDFFNLTWSYKLNSDLPSPYLIIRDSSGTIIGPSLTMHWRKFEDMLPINNALKEKLGMKSRAVAWLVSICTTSSEREAFVQSLEEALKGYMLFLDIFGKCSKSYRCGRPDLILPDCWEVIQEEYYFYLSFENSFDEDYVTEKLLNPLQHYTVPIVFGGANYTRFLPHGTYLNARELGVINLAKEINDIIKNKERYYSFFKWYNHYSYHSPSESPESNPFCTLCGMLNKKTWRKTHQDFRRWWNLPGVCPTEASTVTRGLFL